MPLIRYTYLLTAVNPVDSRRYYIGVRSCQGYKNVDLDAWRAWAAGGQKCR